MTTTEAELTAAIAERTGADAGGRRWHTIDEPAAALDEVLPQPFERTALSLAAVAAEAFADGDVERDGEVAALRPAEVDADLPVGRRRGFAVAAAAQAGVPFDVIVTSERAGAYNGGTVQVMDIRAGYCAVDDFSTVSIDAVEMLFRATSALRHLRDDTNSRHIRAFDDSRYAGSPAASHRSSTGTSRRCRSA
mgnify:CR=1 FL=1